MKLNAVLERELRSRMRSWRSPLTLTIYAGVLAAIGFAFFYLNARNRYMVGYRMGMEMYILLAVVQFILLAFVTPALTAGTISGEKERQTFDILISTKLSAAGVVLGKLAASLSYIFLLIIVTLPLFSLAFLLGGVTVSDLLGTFLIYMLTTVYIASWGMFFSALLRRTQMATVATYLVTLFLGGGTYLIAAFFRAYTGNMSAGVPRIIYVSPTTSLLFALPGDTGLDVIKELSNLHRAGAQAGLDYVLPLNVLVESIIIVLLLVLTVNLVKPVKRWSWLRRKGDKHGKKSCISQ